ncbi:hypothetical protein HDU85_006648 [Gaertneriomyces sp. JEL0708]|nr:hypothetical protein HDU85_006648 [Gaertneriomyces sp. JEL0708]
MLTAMLSSTAAPSFQPPDLPDSVVDALLARLRNGEPVGSFQLVQRVDAQAISEPDLTVIVDKAIKEGTPLVIENSLEAFATDDEIDLTDEELFSLRWLEQHEGGTEISVKNSFNLDDVHMTIREFVDYIKEKPPQEWRNEGKVFYGKDIICPKAWAVRTMTRLPEYFRYKGLNDIFPVLPDYLQADNLMAYVGFDGTNTPGHTDLCGAVGHNLMVRADDNGRAIWFIMESTALNDVSRFWQERGESIYKDNYFAPLDLLAAAPFKVYVIEQKQSDFVIVPPEAAHQVYNKGGVSVKVSWNRMTVDSLRRCVEHVLADYRIHNRPEIYRIKTMVHHFLQKMVAKAETWDPSEQRPAAEMLDAMWSVIESFANVVKDEWIEAPSGKALHRPPTPWDDISEPHARTCDFCRADIWNRGFSCIKCAAVPATKASAKLNQNGEPGGAVLGSADTAEGPEKRVCTHDPDLTFDVCLDCYARGRCCPHDRAMMFHEYIPMGILQAQLRNAVIVYNKLVGPEQSVAKDWLDGFFNGTSSVVPTATVAYEVYEGHNGKSGPSKCCHSCRSSCGPQWAFITCQCGTPYCARCLWNRMGLRFYDVKKQRTWNCPRCTNTCNCLNCLRTWDSKDPIPFPIVAGDVVFLCEAPHFDEERHFNVLPYDKAYPSGPVFKDNRYQVEPPPEAYTRDIVWKARRKRPSDAEAAAELHAVITPSAKRPRVLSAKDLASPKTPPARPAKLRLKSASVPPKHQGKTLQTNGRELSSRKASLGAASPLASTTKKHKPALRAPSDTLIDAINDASTNSVVTTRRQKVPRVKLESESGGARPCRELLRKMDLDRGFLEDFFIDMMSITQEDGPLWAGVHAERTYNEMIGRRQKQFPS